MARPTAAECATYRTRYAEADSALHKLRTGTKSASVSMGEKRVEYTPASVPELARYVEYLGAMVKKCDGCGWSGRRIIGVIPTN